MIDLTSNYLGLSLKNPLVPSASPLSKSLDSARRLEDAGAAAIVMSSLFEEKILAETEHFNRFLYQQDLGYGEANSFYPVLDNLKTYQESYLEHLHQLKSHLSIPIIASLNGISKGGWIDYALALQQSGADALELNMYYIAADIHLSSEQIEHHYLDILQAIKAQITIPITLKLSPQFSSPLHFIQQLKQKGANGVALFNRFYQPDIDLDQLQVMPKLELSNSSEALLRIRWAALLYGRVDLSLAVTGGFHQVNDIIKALLVGADVVHLCSVLLAKGTNHLTLLLQQLTEWLIEHEYQSIQQLKGSLSQQHAIDPSAFERTNYIQVLDSYTPASGVRW
ncbi:MAG: hypothetical protein RL637_1855 [Pseudomonadota bacterium]|jgi:dihydroorotate dehydrogenase (fumarate)